MITMNTQTHFSLFFIAFLFHPLSIDDEKHNPFFFSFDLIYAPSALNFSKYVLI